MPEIRCSENGEINCIILFLFGGDKIRRNNKMDKMSRVH